MKLKSTAVNVAASLAVALFCAAPAYAEIGVAAVVDNQVSGTREGETRSLTVGDGLALNEVVATGDASGAQLLFLDRTSLTLGENAQVELTTFVFDPDGESEVVTSATRGAFRFVSGIAGQNTYFVETPRVTMGIRGSIIESVIDPARMTELHVVVQGSVALTIGGQTVTIDVGEFVIVTAAGTVVGPATWTGPILDITALTDFYEANIANLLESPESLLPPIPDAENFLDGRDQRSQPPSTDPTITTPPGGTLD